MRPVDEIHNELAAVFRLKRLIGRFQDFNQMRSLLMGQMYAAVIEAQAPDQEHPANAIIPPHRAPARRRQEGLNGILVLMHLGRVAAALEGVPQDGWIEVLDGMAQRLIDEGMGGLP